MMNQGQVHFPFYEEDVVESTGKERTNWSGQEEPNKRKEWWTPERRAEQGRRLKAAWAATEVERGKDEVLRAHEENDRWREDHQNTQLNIFPHELDHGDEKVPQDILTKVAHGEFFLVPRDSISILMEIGDLVEWDVKRLRLLKNLVLLTEKENQNGLG